MLMKPQIALPIPEPSLEEILKTLNVFCDPAAIVELRCFSKDKDGTSSGYFDSNHWGDMANEAIRLNRNGLNCYITMNPVVPRLFDRARNKVIRARHATKDVEIIKRDWLLLDFDPVREPSWTAATEEELVLAKKKVIDAYGFLKSCGWPSPIVALSGNGTHLLYRINLPNDRDSTELVRNVLKTLAERFDTNDVTVDQTVSNASRIMKLHGTISTKGQHSTERPWRLSRIIKVPEPLVEVTAEQLRALPALLREKLSEQTTAGGSAAGVNDEFQVTTGPQGLTPRLLSALATIDATSYDTWRKVGAALHYDTRGSQEGLQAWVDWSRTAPEKFEDGTCEREWSSFNSSREGGVTAGTIFHLAKEKGWKERLPIAEEPLPLPDELPQVAPFDFTLLPDSLRPWAKDIAERIQCPPDFVGVGIMVSLAAIVGRKIAIRPQEQSDWTVIANIWGLIVGRPGVLKSPALEATLAPLKRLASKAYEDFTEASRKHKDALMVAKLRAMASEKAAQKELAKNPNADVLSLLSLAEPEEPVLKRYMANDTSPESLGELLRQNSNGLLIYRDELVSLLKGLDREDRAEGRGFYLTAWNGDSSYTFDRIGRGLNLSIEAVCLSILGGTQPGRLAEYIHHAVKGGAADDGLIQRFGMIVWPEINGTWSDVDRWPDTVAKSKAFGVFDYLDKLDHIAIGAEQDTDLEGYPSGIPYLRFSAEGLKAFREWRDDFESRVRSGDLSPALESHFSKYRKLIPALALLLHLADEGRGPITEKATLRALAWGKYLETHARRAYGAITQPEVGAAKAILSRIKKGDLNTSFSIRDIQRKNWAKLGGREQIADGLQLLIDYGYIIEERNTETGGRPSTIYHVTLRGKNEI